jgi:hypothetical protein
MDALAPLIASAITAGTPLMLAALGLLINEKSGVINLGSEGMMLVAAVTGFATAFTTGSVLLGFIAGALAAMVMAGFFAWLTVWLGSNQVATGLALSLFGVGASAYIGLGYTGQSLQKSPSGIPFLEDIPFFGPALFQQHGMVYFSLALCVAVIWFLNRTRSGLVLRAVGESPSSAHSLGYRRLHVTGLHAHVGGRHGRGPRMDSAGPDNLCHLAARAGAGGCLSVWRHHHSYLSYAGAGCACAFSSAFHAAVRCHNRRTGANFPKCQLDTPEYAGLAWQEL